MRPPRLLAQAVLFGLYLVTLSVTAVLRWLRRPRRLSRDRPLRVLLAGTFHNSGWLRAHVKPIAAVDRVSSIVVVTDGPLDPLPKTTYSYPPRWLSGSLTRVGARLFLVGIAAWRHDCDVLIGYHIMPNALFCLVVGAFLGRRAVYQMTGGPGQVIGGSAASDNILLRHARPRSALLENVVLRLLSRFDAIVVRGRRAAAFLAEHGLGRQACIISAGIDLEEFRLASDRRTCDVIFVGRLVPAKGCDLLGDVLIALVRRRPQTRAVVLGDGPLRGPLESALEAAGVHGQVEMPGRRDDVGRWLRRSRVFLLTSVTEGLPIAMLEAMCSGAVPVVPDVGELADLVRTAENGYLVPSRRSEDFVERLLQVLTDDSRREYLSQRASAAAQAYAGLDAVSRRWDVLFGRLAEPGETGSPGLSEDE
jgi:glycosyltransferase involved in cell wall biosynthesis